MTTPPRPPRRPPLSELLAQRILLLDGATGTFFQARGLGEEDYRGERFRDHPRPLLGDHDLLPLTRPEVVAEVHRAYLEAGADIIETDSFNAQRISQADYGLEDHCYEMNRAAAGVARAVADEFTARDPGRPRYVAGSMGPTNRTASLSPEVEDPGFRAVDFDTLAFAYAEQARGLIDGGADLLLIETVFDVLNCKAALHAVFEVLQERGLSLPVFVSGTVADRSGRLLSGQTVEAFWTSIEPFPIAAVGFNCALGATELHPHLVELAALASLPVLCYPNAGLPDQFGEYRQGPDEMAGLIRAFAEEGLVNLVGGCCGTTPEHIHALDAALDGLPPRRPPAPDPRPRFSGLEPLVIRHDSNLVNIGERTNVTGSRRFARLIGAGDYSAALEIARQQVMDGAQILDLCMDEGMLDGVEAMRRYTRLLAAEPDIARVPLMIDSSRWEVVEEGLKNAQGKCIVNSLSLKDGEERFRERAQRARALGAAMVIMAFDERGQADGVERRLEVAERSWKILVEDLGIPARELIFDLNVLAVATGMPEHDRAAADFLEALEAFKRRHPEALASGGISNLSFAFRGAPRVREAMHAVFLYHGVAAGLDLAIVNAGQLTVLADLDPELRERVEDVILARREDACARLIAAAERWRDAEGPARAPESGAEWRHQDAAGRLRYALVHGIERHLEEDLREARAGAPSALAVVEGPLLDGMKAVGELFGSGRMFLPQVVKSARVMKRAVALLDDELHDQGMEALQSSGTLVLATVKGDVHDIGKNIVGTVLGCNGWKIIDLGVMTPVHEILEAARREEADAIGLSGLITPSLDEMRIVAAELHREGMEIPLLIGGATTSAAHTAARIAPELPGVPVVHVPDASRAVGILHQLCDPEKNATFAARHHAGQARLRAGRAARQRERPPLLPISAARSRRAQPDWRTHPPAPPRRPGLHRFRGLSLADLRPYIDWEPFFSVWGLGGRFPALLEDPECGPQASELHRDALALLERIAGEDLLRVHAVVGIFPARSHGDDLLIWEDPTRAGEPLTLPMLRQQAEGTGGRPRMCLADFVAPERSGIEDWIGAFAVNAGEGLSDLARLFREGRDDYSAILATALADRLAEAAAEFLHARVRRELWAYAPDEDLDPAALLREEFQGIRPAPGYPACPDHSLKREIFHLLDAERATGLGLTSSFALDPSAAICGLYFAHPEAHYFGVGRIGNDQLEDYAERRGMQVSELVRWIGPSANDHPIQVEGSPIP